MLKALAHQASGDLPQALAALRWSFDTPEPDSYVRVYLDEGAPMLALLHDAAACPRPRCAGARPTTPRARYGLRRGDGRAAADPGGDPLSHRELEVLRLLDSELTGPEIARELYVTLNTLRTHTKRIFTKLDVTTRAAAVRRGPRTRAPLGALRVTSSFTSCGDALSPHRFLRCRHPRSDRHGPTQQGAA